MLPHGPGTRSLPTPIWRPSGGFTKLIDETPDGWKITPFGQQALQAAPAANASSQVPRKEGRSADHERHYGKKSRDTSWFG